MPPNGFSPFDLVDDFKKSGFSQKQAEALAKALTDVESKNAATKQDLEVTKLELKRDIVEMGHKLTIKIGLMYAGTVAAIFAMAKTGPLSIQ